MTGPGAGALVCPLCGGRESRVVETFPVRKLARVYVRALGADLAPEFDGHLDETLALHVCAGCALRFFSPPLAGAASLYEKLQARPWYYEREKPEYALAARHLPRRGRLLDVGCGAGHFRAHVPGLEYVGLELNGAARAEAVARGLDVRGELLDEHARAHAGAYDAVVAFQVLEHVAAPGALLGAAARCLRPGGILVVSVPAFDGFLGDVEDHALNLPPHHLTLWPDQTLRRVAALIGAELEALEPEPLRDVHRSEARRARVSRALRGLTREPGRLLAGSPLARARSLVASLVVRATPWPGPGTARGHSVTAVYVAGKGAGP